MGMFVSVVFALVDAERYPLGDPFGVVVDVTVSPEHRRECHRV